ncbi:AAA family ATPase [Flectobacillus rivi]|uniref:AAA family ATPase n=1 Tax=Flectobacillus rivi TaxID=2984209 RepID=A0ABT6Z9C4_9BACT|nr:AAA family ATPase [Flectobacillus rivi]MDI9877729.1 AAA family ATPase [Flectobacillus rivi]
MNRKELPNGVIDLLKDISKQVREYNLTAEYPLVAKPATDDYLLLIYPKGHEELFFRIDSIARYEPYDFENSTLLRILLNKKSSKITHGLKDNYRNLVSLKDILDMFKLYLSSLQTLTPSITATETSSIDYSDLFEIDSPVSEPLVNEPNVYLLPEQKELPYTLKQLSVSNFQGILQTKLEAIPVDAQWIFLVGENGFGKTTVLQSIFLGLNGRLDGNTNLVEEANCVIQVEYKSQEESFINDIINNHHPLQHLVAYGPIRLNLSGTQNDEEGKSSISYNLFNSDGWLLNIEYELVKWKLKKDPRFELVKKAFCTLIPQLDDIRYNPDTDKIEYIEKEIDASGDAIYQPLPFKKLASGFKAIIALAGDIILRLSRKQPDIKNPHDLKGIVLIDELDLHLHPKLQREIVGKFSTIFPQIQFIVTTHSPIPLLGAYANSIIIKVTRTKKNGIELERVNIDLKNLTPNLLLTSGVFDLEDFVSVQHENLGDVRTEDSYEELEENLKVEEYLKEFEESNQQFPDELFLPKSNPK